MGSYMNFNQGNGSRPAAVSTPLVRQSSVYSLTFEEFQNTLGGSGRDFGSMNMDELLKNIWTAEETQGMATSSAVVGGQGSSNNNIPPSGGSLNRQGSLTLPRTLSQKTVDEVWKELFKENSGVNNNNPTPVPNLQQQQREPTLGEITLEEFLFRAGVVREETPQMARPNNNGFYNTNNNTAGLTIGFQQSAQNNIGMSNNSNMVPNQPSSLPMNMSGIRPSQQPPPPSSLPMNMSGIITSQQQQQLPQPQPQPQPQPLFPKQATVNFTSSMPMVNNNLLASPRRGAGVGLTDPSLTNGMFQGGGPLGMGAMVSGAKMGSPVNQLSPDVTAISNGDTSSVSPAPYMLNGGGVRGRKSGTLEKAMERRHRRMIKNRESAARSRSRKQAYTLELEAEVEKLKEMNNELRRKQEELMEMQKNQVLETTRKPWGSKRRCLRRTLTGPW